MFCQNTYFVLENNKDISEMQKYARKTQNF